MSETIYKPGDIIVVTSEIKKFTNNLHYATKLFSKNYMNVNVGDKLILDLHSSVENYGTDWERGVVYGLKIYLPKNKNVKINNIRSLLGQTKLENLIDYHLDNQNSKSYFVPSIITEMREDKNWTLTYLSTLAGISGSYLSNIEKGKSNPRSDVLVNLANAFGVDVRRFFYHGSDNMDIL